MIQNYNMKRKKANFDKTAQKMYQMLKAWLFKWAFSENAFLLFITSLSPSPAIEQAPTFTFHINLILRQFARMFLIYNLSK